MHRLVKLLPVCLVVIPTYYVCKSENGCSLFAWGSGRNGELGIGVESNVYSAQQVANLKFNDVSAKRAVSAGVTSDGRLFVWGKAKNNMLANTTDANILLPKQIQFNDKITQVICGYQNMCAINAEGEVYTWGNQQTISNFRNRNKEVVVSKPRKIPNLTKIRQVACSRDETLAIDEYGKLFIWKNRTPTNQSDNKPELINLPGIIKISCGIDFCLALDSHGNLYSWGGNMFGQLGIPSVRKIKEPMMVELKHRIVDIGCGDNYAGAITADGKVFTWGFGNDGQLGHGDRSDQHLPRQMNFEERIQRIACGSGHTAIITNDHRLYLFGRGREGQIGRQPKDEASSGFVLKPRLVESVRNKIIRKVVCGGNHTLALIEQLQS